MYTEEPLLREIKHYSEKNDQVCDWEYVDVIDGFVRMYYKSTNDYKCGFDFYAVQKTSMKHNDNEWDKDCVTVLCVVNGVAASDGVRHLFYGAEETGNFGYFNYQNVDVMIKTLKTLRSLEEKYCTIWQGKKD